MSHRRAVSSVALAVACGASGCADLIGIEERVPSEASSTEAASSGDGTSVVASTSSTGSASSSATGGGGGAGAAGGSGEGGRDTATGSGGAGGCHADLDEDETNCGTCGHDCLGGECIAGECQPVLISAGADVAEYRALHVDPGVDGDIFVARWRPYGEIMRIAKTPGAIPVEVVVLDDAGWAHDLAVDHEWLYYTNYSDSDGLASRGIHAVRRGGGDPVQLMRSEQDGATFGPAFLAVDGADIFFTTFFGSTAVGRVRFGGAPHLALWHLGDSPPYFENQSHLAFDDTWVYCGSNEMGIRRFRRDGTVTELLYPSTTFVDVLAVEDGLVYWRDASGMILRADVAGGGRVLPVGLNGLHAKPLIHGGHIYSTSDDGHDVVRLPLAEPGGVPEVLGYAEDFVIRELAVDEASVYWMDFGDAEIYRRAL